MSSTPQTSNTISNPVVPGFHPDPSICRVGTDYYLACSSFEYFPGVPIFHSRDLVHWTQIGNALERPDQLRLSPDAASSGGIYAPTLRHHDGRFWLITTNVHDGGNLLFTATDPAGPWSDPIRVPGVPGIDPDLAWDDDGNCWCTYAGVGQIRIDPHTGESFGPTAPALVRHRRCQSSGSAASVPDRRLLVLAHRRRRHRARSWCFDRSWPHTYRPVRAVPGQPDSDAPRNRLPHSERRSRGSGGRHPTVRGGWCCSGCDRAVAPRAGTCSAARRSWPR
ncbi:hypothetical protein GCM10018966_095050 [Streptomyces yanii]